MLNLQYILKICECKIIIFIVLVQPREKASKEKKKRKHLKSRHTVIFKLIRFILIISHFSFDLNLKSEKIVPNIIGIKGIDVEYGDIPEDY